MLLGISSAKSLIFSNKTFVCVCVEITKFPVQVLKSSFNRFPLMATHLISIDCLL